MKKYSVDQEQLEAIRNGEQPVGIKKLKQAESKLAKKEFEMAEIAEVSHEDMHNALEESGVKPLVSSSPIKHDT